MAKQAQPVVRDYLYALANRDGSKDIDCQAVVDQVNENLAEQSHKDDCDINVIVNRMIRTGVQDPFIARPGEGVYGDFTQWQDYQDNLNLVIKAQEAFDSLDANIRKRFENDPVQLMEFLADEKNRPEAESLGLVAPKPLKAPLIEEPKKT